ncbi:MAG: XRE family transcriptional regulator [Chitinophagales bacterium]
MDYIKTNIVYIRKKILGLTQAKMAQKLEVPRSRIGSYEEGRAGLPIPILRQYATFAKVSIDELVNEDLRIEKLKKQTFGISVNSTYNKDVKGTQLRTLATTRDDHGFDNIEFVAVKAHAGYTNNCENTKWLANELEKFQLPGLAKDVTYRAFEIEGDSMAPLKTGTVVIGRYAMDWTKIESGLTYIIVSDDPDNIGVFFKRVFNTISQNGHLTLYSDNPKYPPFTVHINHIKEVWQSQRYIVQEAYEDAKLCGRMYDEILALRKALV